MSYGGAQAMYAKMQAQMAAKAAESAAGSSESAAAEPAEPPAALVKTPTATVPADGVLLTWGSTHFAKMGTAAQTDEAPNLFGPRRLLSGLGSIKIASVSSGCTSAHVVAVGVDGEAFAWGRNNFGQLGHGDLTLRPGPARVEALSATPIAAASTGKVHTIFLSTAGELRGCGACKQGAVGPMKPSDKAKGLDHQLAVSPILGVPPVACVASGSNFNLAVDREGGIWAWGYGENGVLGNGTDGEHNTKEGSVKLAYEVQGTPTRIRALADKKMVHAACGAAHCAALSDAGVVFTWGCGDYGRLGHRDLGQKDLHTPRPLEECRGQRLFCGHASTACFGWPVLRNGQVCMGGGASLYMWGRVKAASQDCWMYPRPEDDLRGWQLHEMGCGYGHFVVSADSSVIAWGAACASGELGFGEGGKKSSARPDKVNSLEGVKVCSIALGMNNSTLLVENSDKVRALPEFTPVPPPAPSASSSADGAAGGAAAAAPKPKSKAVAHEAAKRKAEPGAAGGKKKK